MTATLSALTLAFRQLADPAILRLLGKSLAVSLALFALLGWLGWYWLDKALRWAGAEDGAFLGAGELREVATLVLTLLGAWLLWRVIAMAVIEFYAGDVVIAVERRHYPGAADRARELTIGEETAASLKGAFRALLVNLAILPFALALLVTGIGTALLFWIVNAVLIGRELVGAVWLRHRHAQGERAPVSRFEGFVLGGAIAALLLAPFVNLLAPLIGAAAATHLTHRKAGKHVA